MQDDKAKRRGEPERRETHHVWVEGLVAARDKLPYVTLELEGVSRVQLTVAEARNIAADLTHMAARTEADAMILRFFDKANFPEGAAAALLVDFREFRRALDEQPVERSINEPSGEGGAEVV
jgi:hypothetical protein